MQHTDPAPIDLPGQMRHERGLAYTRFAVHARDDGHLPLRHLVHEFEEGSEFGVAPEQAGRSLGQQSRRYAGRGAWGWLRRRGRTEPVVQDALVQLAQRGAREEAGLFGQRGSGVAEGTQCLGGVTATVERGGEEPPAGFVQRIFAYQLLQRREHLPRSAQGEQQLEASIEQAVPASVESGGQPLTQGEPAYVGQARPTP